MAQQLQSSYYEGTYKVHVHGQTINGVKVGVWVEFDENGNTLRKWAFVEGKETKPEGDKKTTTNLDDLTFEAYLL